MNFILPLGSLGLGYLCLLAEPNLSHLWSNLLHNAPDWGLHLLVTHQHGIQSQKGGLRVWWFYGSFHVESSACFSYGTRKRVAFFVMIGMRIHTGTEARGFACLLGQHASGEYFAWEFRGWNQLGFQSLNRLHSNYEHQVLVLLGGKAIVVWSLLSPPSHHPVCLFGSYTTPVKKKKKKLRGKNINDGITSYLHQLLLAG